MSTTLGRISLFINNKKSASDCDLSGYMKTEKGKYLISLWEETSETGTKYWTGRMSEGKKK